MNAIKLQKHAHAYHQQQTMHILTIKALKTVRELCSNLVHGPTAPYNRISKLTGLQVC